MADPQSKRSATEESRPWLGRDICTERTLAIRLHGTCARGKCKPHASAVEYAVLRGKIRPSHRPNTCTWPRSECRCPRQSARIEEQFAWISGDWRTTNFAARTLRRPCLVIFPSAAADLK